MRKFNGKGGAVHASKILDITAIEGDLILDSGRVSHSKEWHRQHGPKIGEWYVLEENGAARVMSTGDFKSQYELQPDTTIPVVDPNRHAERDERAKAAEDRPVPREQQDADKRREANAKENEGKRPATVADAQAMENANAALRDAQAATDRTNQRRAAGPAPTTGAGETIQERQGRENAAQPPNYPRGYR